MREFATMKTIEDKIKALDDYQGTDLLGYPKLEMQFVIKRSNWLRGEGSDDSYLLRESDGKMCCLGFYLESLGCPLELLDGAQGPSDVPIKVRPKKGKWLINDDPSLCSIECNELIKANDEAGDDGVREEEIIRLFAKEGITVKFED
jgi:hypothetical protein